ncbi:MAG: hypothetical protein ACKOWF_16970 [Chloroflexota bacterium]
MPAIPSPARRAILSAQAIALGGALAIGAVASAAAAAAAAPVAQDAACTALTVAMPEMAAATPEAEQDLVGTAASEEVTAAATAAAENAVACFNSGDLGAFLSTVTPNFLQTSFGVADAKAAEAALPELNIGAISEVELSNAYTYENGQVSIDAHYNWGDHQHVDGRWYMVEVDGQWLIDHEHLLPPDAEGDKAFVSYSVADDASPVGLDQRSEISTIPVLVLHGINNGESHRFFTVHALPAMEGTPMPGEMPEGGKAIGFVAIAPGEQEDLALVGLEPGLYAISDSAVEGSVALLTITEPAS